MKNYSEQIVSDIWKSTDKSKQLPPWGMLTERRDYVPYGHDQLEETALELKKEKKLPKDMKRQINKRLKANSETIIRYALAPAEKPKEDENSWLEKEVKNPETGNIVKVKSLPPEIRERYRPKREPVKEEKKKLEQTDKNDFSQNDYSSVDLKTLSKNLEHNLSKYDDTSVNLTKVGKSEPLTSKNWDSFKKQIHGNAKTVLNKYRNAMAPDAQRILSDELDRMIGHVTKGIEDGSLKVSSDKIDNLIQDNIKKMVHQEIETRRRSLGDHGIRHVIADARNTNKMLDELEAGGIKTTGAQRLAGSIAAINHDLGYTVGKAATTFKGHKENSAVLFDLDRKNYEDIFGKDLTNNMHHWIATHDEAIYDWENDPVGSSLRLADCTSLFAEDKIPEMFFKSDKATKVLTKMRLISQVGGSFEPYKKELNNVIDEMQVTDIEKHELKESLNEISNFGVDDFLSRYSGKLKGFKFNKDKKLMEINVAQSPEYESIQGLFEIGQKKFNSLAEDLSSKGGKPDRPNRNTTIFKNENGKQVVQVNLTDRDKDPINLTANENLKQLYRLSIRPQINDLKRELSVPPPLDHGKLKETTKNLVKKLPAVQKKFIGKTIGVYVSYVKKNKLDTKPEEQWTKNEITDYKKVISIFNQTPLTEEEQKFLSEKVAYKIAQTERAQKEIPKAKKLIHYIKSIIERNKGAVKVFPDNRHLYSFGDDTGYYLIAEFEVNAPWFVYGTMLLKVLDDGEIILTLKDKDRGFDLGDLSWYEGKGWVTSDRFLKPFADVLNKRKRASRREDFMIKNAQDEKPTTEELSKKIDEATSIDELEKLEKQLKDVKSQPEPEVKSEDQPETKQPAETEQSEQSEQSQSADTPSGLPIDQPTPSTSPEFEEMKEELKQLAEELKGIKQESDPEAQIDLIKRQLHNLNITEPYDISLKHAQRIIRRAKSILRKIKKSYLTR